jgi:hypothetical protein
MQEAVSKEAASFYFGFIGLFNERHRNEKGSQYHLISGSLVKSGAVII